MRSLLAAAAVVVTCSCGAFGVTADPAPSDDDAGVDAAADAPSDGDGGAVDISCRTRPFGPVSRVRDETGASSYRPWLAGNVAYAAFSSTIVKVSLVNGDPVGPLAPVPLKKDAGVEHSHPIVFANGTRLFFQHAEVGSTQIYSATRASVQQEFGTAAPLAINGPGTTREEPWVVDDSTVYFASDVAGAEDLFVAQINAAGAALPVQGVNDPVAQDEHPVVTPDELVIYFSSDRHSGGIGNKQIYVASRSDKTMPFSQPARVNDIEVGMGNNRPTWLSDDGCTLYFTSDREGAYRVYRATRR